MRSVFLTLSERVLHFSCGTEYCHDTDRQKDRQKKKSESNRIESKCNSITSEVLRTSRCLKVQNAKWKKHRSSLIVVREIDADDDAMKGCEKGGQGFHY
jgi:hypothetical protein